MSEDPHIPYPPQSDDLYASWSRRGREATLRGEFQKALEAFEQAREALDEDDDPGRLDSAELNLAMIRIQMGNYRDGEEGLREILMRSADPRIGFSAAYNLASSLRKQGRHDRAMSYASRALDRAHALQAVDLIAAGHNLKGNIYLNQSFLEEALEQYDKSLRLRESQPGDVRYSKAILLENIGYCLLLLRRLRPGIERIREALELAREAGDRRCRVECLQDLCYGFLLSKRYRESVEFGRLALDEAVDAEYRDIEENCHYLLGELGSKVGDEDSRDRHFQRLQDLHPELPFLREFLCAVDVTSIITLKR